LGAVPVVDLDNNPDKSGNIFLELDKRQLHKLKIEIRNWKLGLLTADR
jgi:hypothetical protein